MLQHLQARLQDASGDVEATDPPLQSASPGQREEFGVSDEAKCLSGDHLQLYREGHLLANLDWVGFDWCCSTICLVIPTLVFQQMPLPVDQQLFRSKSRVLK